MSRSPTGQLSDLVRVQPKKTEKGMDLWFSVGVLNANSSTERKRQDKNLFSSISYLNETANVY